MACEELLNMAEAENRMRTPELQTIKTDFYLVLDLSIICSYLASHWISTFQASPHFKGIILPTPEEPEDLVRQRQQFHQEYLGHHPLTPELREDCLKVYPEMDKTEWSMLENFGVSQYSPTSFHQTFFLGNKVNSPSSRRWLEAIAQESPPAIFVCATCILKPWWIELTNAQLFNCHSAVLPYARGMYAIENVAAQRDIEQFKQAAGFTIHYIDAGVDTGAIIQAQRLRNPLRFDSIWELKAHTYYWEFEQYVKFAREYLHGVKTEPVGVIASRDNLGPNFRMRDFTPERRRDAELGYLWMKALDGK